MGPWPGYDRELRAQTKPWMSSVRASIPITGELCIFSFLTRSKIFNKNIWLSLAWPFPSLRFSIPRKQRDTQLGKAETFDKASMERKYENNVDIYQCVITFKFHITWCDNYFRIHITVFMKVREWFPFLLISPYFQFVSFLPDYWFCIMSCKCIDALACTLLSISIGNKETSTKTQNITNFHKTFIALSWGLVLRMSTHILLHMCHPS